MTEIFIFSPPGGPVAESLVGLVWFLILKSWCCLLSLAAWWRALEDGGDG